MGEDSPAFAEAVLAFVAKKHVKNVIIAAHWTIYPATESFKASLLATVRATLDAGANVYVLKSVPEPGLDVPRVLALTATRCGNLESLGVSREEYEKVNRSLVSTFEEISKMGAVVLDPAVFFLNSRGAYGVFQQYV